MSEKGTSFNDYLLEKLKDPELACHFISEAMTEHDTHYLKVALGDIVKAYRVEQISEQAGINGQTIYKMLSEKGDLTHKNLVVILDALGLELTVRPKSPMTS